MTIGLWPKILYTFFMPGTFKTVTNTHKHSKLITIGIGILLSIPLLIIGFYFLQTSMTRANNAFPHDVIVSEITATTAKITWSTDQDTQGVIEYGTSQNALVFYAPENGNTRQHEVELTLLTPRTTHYFKIRINDDVYDNGGAPWTFTTKSSETDSTSKEGTGSGRVIQSLDIPNSVGSTSGGTPTPRPTAGSCNETDCVKIQQKFGNGCSVSDYIKCIKTTPTAGPSPTITPTGAISPSPTMTPTSTPTSTPTPTGA